MESGFKYIFTEVDGILEASSVSSDILQYDKSSKKGYLVATIDVYGHIITKPILRMGNEPQDLCDGFYIDIPGRAFNPLWVYKDFASCQKAATLLEENYIKGFIKTEKGLIFVWDFSRKEAIDQYE